ncbi:Response regulator MprA [Pseudoalteromonas sp. P1-9]|uniref:response regulator n=1 Tax=Pseudoalteromonas sp. P1-9 TaxID=1710354 RepID=UPI0006D5D7C4|nr:response regulator [Pseudoalteromonas sp. P1-9]KPV95925.1 Response regulator MprA [Pseudoalteromonas sp. P1-9]
MLTSVLAIDDDKLIHQIIEKTLTDNNQVSHAYNGEEGIKMARDTHPDIILLDVEMPGINGFEVCSKLKQQRATQDIPIMFLSSRSSLEERIKGYNSGADDYIVKPFETEELLARIKVLHQYKKQSQSLKQDIEQAQNTAAIAMTDYSDMGRAMRYVSQTYGVKSLTRLSECLFEFFSPLNLNVVTAFWFESGNEFFSNNSAVCPLEKELMLNAKEGERFIDFGSRTIINYPNVSLLVKNMPVDDAPLYGRYKDLFPHILEATNAKLGTLELHNQLSEQAQQITKTFELVDSTLRAQLQSLYNNSKVSVELIETLYQRFCDTVPRLALESDQEEYILGSVEETVESLRHHLTVGDEIQSSFNEVMTYLDHIMKEREKILERLEQEQQREEINEITSQDDIELF